MTEKKELTKEEVSDIKNFISQKEIITKEASLSWDGKNIIIRLPKELTEEFSINKENRFEKSILFKIEKSIDGKITNSFEFIKRNKPKRKDAKKKTSNKKL